MADRYGLQLSWASVGIPVGAGEAAVGSEQGGEVAEPTSRESGRDGQVAVPGEDGTARE